MMTGPRASAGGRGDWWIRGVGPLALVHVALFLALQARPGSIAPPLWTWGPPVLAVVAIVLLAVALVSARRSRQTWTGTRGGALAALVVLVGAPALYRTFPSEYDSRPSGVLMQLPLDGPVTVAWGGPSARVNYHVRSPAERWAFDLLVTIDGRSHRGSGHAVADYYVYDRPVFAPAGGRVVAVNDGVPDATPGKPEQSRRGGNWLVIEVADAQFLFLMHLKADSIRVQPGIRVRRGDVVARVGNSGNSTEPHLHVHLQDRLSLDIGQGIPFFFANYMDVRTATHIDRGMPEGGIRGGRHVGDIVQLAGGPLLDR